MVFVALLLVSVISNHYWHDFWAANKWQHLFSYSVVPYLWAFLLGGLVSLYWDKLRPFFENKLLYWLLPFLLFVMIGFFWPQSGLHTGMTIHTVREFLMNTLLSAVVVSGAFSYVKFNKVLRGNDISYGVYLFHGLVINLIIEITDYRGLILYPVVFVASVVLGYLSWRYIESPALSLKTRIK